MAYVTEDGSIIDRAGKVIFFSAQRFVDDICLGNCCFICGARPEEKPFNNEHILPEWLLRRYDLFTKTIMLPNDRMVRYDRCRRAPRCAYWFGARPQIVLDRRGAGVDLNSPRDRHLRISERVSCLARS
jgi:hypothetical protein